MFDLIFLSIMFFGLGTCLLMIAFDSENHTSIWG